MSDRDLVPKPPRPEDTGQEGSQRSSEEISTPNALIIHTKLAPDQSHLGAVLGEQITPRSPAALTFALAAYRDLEEQRESLVQRLDAALKDKERYLNMYHQINTENAVLKDRQKSRTRQKLGQQLAQTCGGITAGAGLTMLFEKGILLPGSILLVSGLVFVAIGILFGLQEVEGG